MLKPAMNDAIDCLNRAAFALASAIFLSAFPAKAQFPAYPPSSVTNAQDRDQMMWQLGLSYPVLPPKLADPNAPQNSQPSSASNPEGNWTDAAGHTITRSGHGLWNNYDDVAEGFFPGFQSWRVGTYTPIDLLRMNDGTLITTPEQWWSRRRPELLKDVQEQVWGVVPPDSILPKVVFSVTTSTGGSGNSAYIQKVITGIIDNSRYPGVRKTPVISAVLRTPANAGPVPVMVVIGGGFWTPIDAYWGYCRPNGWGVCVFNAALLQPDNGANLTSYLIGLCNQGGWRKPADWGSLAAWAWGVSRLIDYFQTDADVDAAKIGVTGHSRFGKAALVAMAYETRLAVAFPSCAGSLGTKMNRRHWGQDLENSGWDQEYHWVAGNFFKWMGPLNQDAYLPRKIELCPVDAHSLLSLCAPRPVFLNGGRQDSWTDPYGMFLTGLGATPVYRLLGGQGLMMPDAKPQVDVGYLSGDIAFRYHAGGHTDTPDWPAFFQFVSKFIRVSNWSVSPSALVLNASTDSKATFDITSDTTWTVAVIAPQAWLTVNPASGSHNGTVTVMADGNTTDSTRTATVSVSASGLLPQSVTVTQSVANTPALSVSPSTLNVNVSANSTAAFQIVSNTVWNVSTLFTWLSVNPASGINSRFVTITAANNPSAASRTATLTVSGNGVESQTITVVQAGTTSIEKNGVGKTAKAFGLYQNYPNPFNPSTTILFGLPDDAYVSLKIENLLGEEIGELAGKHFPAGMHSVSFDASQMAGGIYFCRIVAAGRSAVKKMLLQK